jgi:hypothetical protein
LDQASSNAKYRAAIGEQLVAQGSSGLQMGTGSMLDAINQSRINQTYAAMQISQQAASRASAYNTQAGIASRSATGSLLSGLLTGTSSFLSKQMDYANAGAAYGYGTDPTNPAGALRVNPKAIDMTPQAGSEAAISDNALNSVNKLDAYYRI